MCPGLEDLFPEEFRQQHAAQRGEEAAAQVEAQAVIILRIPNFNVNYDKFVVLVSSSVDDTEIAACPINTDPSRGDNHVVIGPERYDFLDHESHVDCSTLVPFQKAFLQELLRQEPDRLQGLITDEDYIDVIMQIRRSWTITDAEREQFNL